MAGPVDLVIFDCDGVLVDSEKLAITLVVQIAQEVGMELTPEAAIERFMGRSEGLFQESVEEHLGRPLTEAERARNHELFTTEFEQRLTPVEGVAEAIDALAYEVCVASSSNPDSLSWKLALCGLTERFGDHVFSAAQVKHGKPAPDLFLFAASTLGVDPARCVVIEDSQYGVQAARAAGMRAFGYLAGMVAPAALAGPNTVLFEDMRELPGLISAL